MSKISFNLDKIIEKNDVGFYKVSGSSLKAFYLSIDRLNRVLSIYMSDDFENPVRVIDTTHNFSIAGKDGIDVKILAPVLARSIEIMNMNMFPSCISYAA